MVIPAVICGYAFAWVGHFFVEHNRPATFKYPLWSFAADLRMLVSILRVTAAWLAGISHMPWWRFLFWNAAGGVVWATAFGVVAYYSGRAAADAINHYGLYAGIGLAVLIVIAVVGIHFWRRRMIENRQ